MRGFTIVKKIPATSLKLAKLIANYTADMKAEDIAVLDMHKVVNFGDYFVLGYNGLQARGTRLA